MEAWYATRTVADGADWRTGLTLDSDGRFDDSVFPPARGSWALASSVKFVDVADIFAASAKYLEISLYTADSKKQGRCAKWSTKLSGAPTVSGSATRLPRSTAAKTFLAPQIERLVAAISDPEMLELGNFFVDGAATTSAAKLLAGVRANIAKEPTAFAGMRDFVCTVDSGGKRAKISIELKFHELSVELFSRGDDADAQLAEPGDINQGSVGDCYFLSALAVLSTREELLFSIFPDACSSDVSLGAFGVRFWRDGAWRVVVVDAKMPTHARRTNELIACSPAHGTAEIWTLVAGASVNHLVCNCWSISLSSRSLDPSISSSISLARSPPATSYLVAEKAYAKLNGSYGAIESGKVR